MTEGLRRAEELPDLDVRPIVSFIVNAISDGAVLEWRNAAFAFYPRLVWPDHTWVHVPQGIVQWLLAQQLVRFRNDGDSSLYELTDNAYQLVKDRPS